MNIALIALGGGLGCVSRYALSGAVYNLFGKGFPYGTLAVNALGTLIIGFLMEFGLHSTLLPANLRVGLTVGFLGGLTTFSTFSYETFRLLEEGDLFFAGLNALGSVALCLFFAWVGISAARLI